MVKSEEIVSEIFRVPAGAMIRKMAFRFARTPFILLALLIIAAGIAAFADIRWLIVTLMLICIVAPMVMVWLYFYYGLRSECFINILPHRLHINKEGIKAIICSGEDDDSHETEYFFDKSSLRPYMIGMKSISVPISRNNKITGFIILPAYAFGGMENLNETATLLSGIITSENKTQNEINQRS